MLKTLQIKDYALIENILIEFGKGLNIITGETGAGKSILIDAMGLLLGERASTEVVRKGAEKSFVEGIFDISGNKRVNKLLGKNDIEINDELIVRREISLKGTNRCFLNDTPVTLNLIKDVGDLLVDLHGQHEHQSLLRTETHIEMLDEFANLYSMVEKFQKTASALGIHQKELRDLFEKESLIKGKKDIYEFQINEIDSISPRVEEEEKLETELKILENSERLVTLTNEIYNSIYDEENSIRDRLADVKNKINELANIDEQFVEKTNEVNSAFSLIDDISSFVRSYKEKIDVDPERLNEMRERLGSLNRLKKKYGGNIASVLEHRKKIGEEFELAENFSGKISLVQNKIEALRKECGTIAKKLSSERKSISKRIKKEIETALKSLGIQDSVFEIKIQNEKAGIDSNAYIVIDEQKFKYNQYGYDNVEFFVSTNIGEDPKPLVKVASGGEVSRIMLALKSILAKSDMLPLLIFDEIDTGVSGRIALKVGETLKSLASYHQIIAITHLPQIAGLSDHHFVVEKEKINDRVVSSISKLELEKRIIEIAKLMSGEKITDAAIKSAKELMRISVN